MLLCKKALVFWGIVYLVSVVMLISFLALTEVCAGGFSTTGQGSRALSMGGAFTAVADDGSSIYYNPSGMNQIEGTQIEAGIAFIFPEIKYEQTNGATQKSTKDALAPTLFVVSSFTDKFSAGFGVYSAFARDSDFSDDLANGFPSQRSKIMRIDFSPVISYKFNEHFSIGGGLVVGYGELDQSVPAGPNSRVKDDLDGIGFGGIIGVLWKINKYIKVGGTYRSRMKIDLDGTRTFQMDGVEIKSDASVDFRFPSSLALGLAFMPNEKLTLSFNLDWYEWSYFNEIVTKTDDFPDSTVRTNADDSMDFRIGGEFRFTEDWALRAGFAKIQGAVPDSNIFPSQPDADGYTINLGLGKRFGKLGIDLVYEYGFYEEDSKNNVFGFDGDYTITHSLIGLTASYRF